MNRYRMLPSYHYYDVEGNSPLTLDKSVGKPLRDYKIYGNSVQDGTPTPENPVEIQCVGDKTKNLLNPVMTEYIWFNGSASAGYTLATASHPTANTVKVIPNTTLFLSGDLSEFVDSMCRCGFTKEYPKIGDVLIQSKALRTNTSITVPNDCHYLVWSTLKRLPNGLTNEIQLEYGETATEYEPYGKYKIPVEDSGKNLFNEDDFIEIYTPYHTTSSTITNKTEFDGYKCLKVWGAVNANGLALEYMKGQFKENTQYTFSVDAYDVLSNKMYGASLCIVYTDGTKTTYNLINSSGDDRIRKAEQWCTTVTTSAYGKTISHLLRGFGTGGGYTYIKNFQIEEGTTATDYEPYKEPIKTNIYLDEPLMGKLFSNVTEADCIDFIDKKVFKDYGYRVLTGDETYALRDGFTNTFHITFLPSTEIMRKGRCSHFPDVTTANFDKKNGVYTSSTSILIVSMLGEEFANNPEALRAWVIQQYENGTPVTVVYRMGLREGYAPLTKEIDIDLPPILTHKGTNVISVGTTIPPSNMQIQYYK